MKPIFLFILGLCSQMYFSQLLERDLSHEHWLFGEEGKNISQKASVPSTIHTDLHSTKAIPDPFYGDNEKKLQWIEEKNWVYKTNFKLSGKELKFNNLDLIFEGLDTYADVFLNGNKILSANNMFRTWKVDAKQHLKTNNELKIVFYSASEKGKQLAQQLPYKLPENERVFVRKAQYHFGWDWGPKFVTAGIWKPIKLQMWNDAKINHIKFGQKLSEKQALLNFSTEIQAEKEGKYSLNINDKKFDIYLKKGLNIITKEYTIHNPKLWYPTGFGEAYLYPFQIVLNKNSKILNKKNLNIGLREIELIQEKDAVGKSFYFKVNGIPIYAKGFNIIPPHFFVPLADKNIYKQWIKEAKFTNTNMLRVWGGGIYADDEFYDECNKNGILVWQDFMFACAMYPGDKDFLDNVKQEVTDQAKRLQNHPSLALWCGNNENDEGWHNWGWQKQLNYTKQDSTKVWHDYVKTFRELIPKTLDSVSAQKPIYWQSSPSNGWGRDIAYKEGDVHYWGVWWGKEPFEKYREKTGRFVSEYGFQGMPPLSTFRTFTQNLDLEDSGVKNHQKHPTGFENINILMDLYYGIPKAFEDYNYVSQLLQAQGLKTAVEAHRQKKPYNMGTLYWQLNDVWPVTSWSSIDFYGNRKAVHYEAKRVFEPLFLSVEESEKTYKLWLNNDLNQNFNGNLNIELTDFKGNNLYQKSVKYSIGNTDNKVILEIPKSDFSQFDLKQSVLKMIMDNDQQTATTLHYFHKPKNLVLGKVDLKIEQIGERKVKISANQLVKGIYLQTSDFNNFSDNFFDLLPNETKIITAEKPIKDLVIKSLNHLPKP